MQELISVAIEPGQVIYSWLPAAIGLGSALFSIGSGLARGSRARRLERNNPFPTATVDPNIVRNQQRAGQLARVGLPGFNNYLSNIFRSQAGALRGATTSGRSVNVASILGQTNQALLGLGTANEEARINNERLAMDANTAMSAENQRVWNWNEATRYQQMAQRIAQLRGAGQQDLYGGIGMIGQLGAAGVLDNLGGIFGSSTPTTTPATTNAPVSWGASGFGMSPYPGLMA